MSYHMALKGKLYLDDKKKQIVAFNDGASRYVYNHLVATNNELYQLKKINISISLIENCIDYLMSTIKNATAIKNSAPFLYQKERHTGVPTFHKKGTIQSYQTSNHYKKDAKHMNDGSIRILVKNHKLAKAISDVS